MTPEGKPAEEKLIAWALPEIRFAVSVFDVEEPAVTELLPPLTSEKSNAGATTGGVPTVPAPIEDVLDAVTVSV